MKNSVINYDLIERDNYILRDYTSKNPMAIYKMDEINDDTYIEYYRLTDNETIEGIAYKLYGSTQYWDLLLMINISDPLFDMVYDFDNMSTEASRFIAEYNNEVYVNPSLPFNYLNELIDKKVKLLESLKEERRPLKIIKAGKILDFMKLLRQLEII